MKIDLNDCLEPATKADDNKVYDNCSISYPGDSLLPIKVYAPDADDEAVYNRVPHIHYNNNHAYMILMVEDYQTNEIWINIGNNTWIKLGGTLEDNRQYDKHKLESAFATFTKVGQEYYTVYYA